MRKLIAASFAAAALLAGAAFADDAHHAGTAQPAVADAGLTEGEVRKVDRDGGKITLKHGEIKNLGMPGMTMVFRVNDGKLLDDVQPGAKVRFRAEQAEGELVVVTMEPAG